MPKLERHERRAIEKCEAALIHLREARAALDSAQACYSPSENNSLNFYRLVERVEQIIADVCERADNIS